MLKMALRLIEVLSQGYIRETDGATMNATEQPQSNQIGRRSSRSWVVPLEEAVRFHGTTWPSRDLLRRVREAEQFLTLKSISSSVVIQSHLRISQDF